MVFPYRWMIAWLRLLWILEGETGSYGMQSSNGKRSVTCRLKCFFIFLNHFQIQPNVIYISKQKEKMSTIKLNPFLKHLQNPLKWQSSRIRITIKFRRRKDYYEGS